MLGDKGGDIWMSTRQADQSWGRAINLGLPVNNTQENRVIGSSLEREEIYLKNSYSNTEGPIAIARLEGRNWTSPKGMPVKGFQNRSKEADFFVPHNGRILLMAIQAENTLGKRDLYVSFREDEDSWSKPLHLGNIINSKADEGSIFLAPDGQSLYFASKGHKSTGGYDLFVSRRLDNSWTNWSKPLNLGDQLNTSEDDLHISIAADGKKAFLVRRASDGTSNLVQASLAEHIQPTAYTLLNGRLNIPEELTDMQWKAYWEASNLLEVKDSFTIKPDGTFHALIPADASTCLYVDAEEYYSVSRFVSATEEEAAELDFSSVGQQIGAKYPLTYFSRDTVLKNLGLETRAIQVRLQYAYDALNTAEKDLDVLQLKEQVLVSKEQWSKWEERYDRQKAAEELKTKAPFDPTLKSDPLDTLPEYESELGLQILVDEVMLYFENQPADQEEVATDELPFDETDLWSTTAPPFENFYLDIQEEILEDNISEVVTIIKDELLLDIRELIKELWISDDLPQDNDLDQLEAEFLLNSLQGDYFPISQRIYRIPYTNWQLELKADIVEAIREDIVANSRLKLIDGFREILEQEVKVVLLDRELQQKLRKIKTEVNKQVREEERNSENLQKSLVVGDSQLLRDSVVINAMKPLEIKLLPIQKGQILPLETNCFSTQYRYSKSGKYY